MTPLNSSLRTAWRAGLWLVLGACLWNLGGAVQAAGREADGIKLKTPPANLQRIAPLRDALFAFDDEIAAKDGKLPKNAKAQVEKMQSLAAQAKGEIRAFTSRLRAADEISAFDAMVEAEAKRAGSPELLAELRGSGGAFATLTMADVMIDDMLADRRRAADQATVGLLFRMMGIGEARAAVGCAFFWWVISAGYGTAHAYRSCYY